MKIILRQEVDNLGEAGTLQDVAAGYGRNYLIPQGLAVLATPGEMKNYEANQKAKAFKTERQERELQSLADAISQVSLQFKANAGEQGRLFGAITASDIAEQISAAIGQEIDRRKVVLDSPIRSTGTHTVHVHLVGKLRPAVTVVVTGIGGEEVTEEEVVEVLEIEEIDIETDEAETAE